jgi:4-hydroxy-4-methyl-2-oxoglutarate aldolase
VSELISTAAVLEASGGRARAVHGLSQLTLMDAICAPAATCACAPGDNLALHRLLQGAAEGTVLVVAAGGRADAGYFGELMAMDAEERDLQGLVIDGSIRDGGRIAVLGFPVFHAGFAPATCVKAVAPSVGEPVEVGGATIAPGDQMVADSDAVLVVAAADWPSVETAALEIQSREDDLRTHILQGGRLGDLIELPE